MLTDFTPVIAFNAFVTEDAQPFQVISGTKNTVVSIRYTPSARLISSSHLEKSPERFQCIITDASGDVGRSPLNH